MDEQTPDIVEDSSATDDSAVASLPDVLDLVLQRSRLRNDVKTCCRLLETSRAVASPTARHLSCHGGLDLTLELALPGRAEAVAPWLARHGRGIGQLYMCCSMEDSTPDALAEAIATGAPVLEALQRAAAGKAGEAAGATAPRLPLLQHLRLFNVAPATAVPLLQMVPQLTQLFINIEYGEEEDANTQGAAEVGAAVAGLSGLQVLFLCNSAAAVLPELCTNNPALRDLEIHLLPDVSLLQALPEQLQELRINNVADVSIWSPDASWVHLAHCTALTSLTIDPPFGSGGSLPGSLVKLDLNNGCRSCQPLLGLQQLRRLRLWGVSPALDMRGLAALQQLSSVDLSYSEVPLAASSQAWGVLPLSSLSFPALLPVNGHLATLDHLGQTGSSLRHLQLEMLPFDGGLEQEPAMAAWPLPLAGALSKLTGLESLCMKTEPTTGGDGDGGAFGAGDGGANMAELADALVGLHSLQHLSLSGPFWDSLVPQLQCTGTQLTCLALSDCTFSGKTLAGLMQRFGQLRALRLGGCRIGVLEKESLAAFVRHLPRLTELQL